jgi:cell division inhibitor SepF
MHTSVSFSSSLPGVPAVGVRSDAQQVLVMTPRSLGDARLVLEAVRDQQTVVVNAAWLEDAPGQRLIDFVCGGLEALDGQVLRVDEEVFLFAPGGARLEASPRLG